MPEVLIPLTFDDLPVKPPLVGRPRISEDLQQTVALLVGWDNSTRRLVRCSPSGVLFVCQPTVKGVVNIEANDYSYNWSHLDILTSEAMILAHPDNASRIWVNKGIAAAPDIGLPLDAGDSIIWGLNNLNSLYIHIVNTGEKAIVVYTV
ncbi:hypothetical protein ES703_53940 [subsurface metagenome]